MEIKTLEEPVQSWNALTWEQLIDVVQIWHGVEPELMRRLKVLLLLKGWEIVDSEIDMPWVSRADGEWLEKIQMDGNVKKVMRMYDKVLLEMQDVLDGKGNVFVVVRDRDGGMMRISCDNLLGAAVEMTEWLDKPEELLRIPVGEMRIGKHVYVMPGVAMSDVEFGQFERAQKCSEREWDIASDITDVDTSGTVAEGETVGATVTVEEMREKLAMIEDVRREFLACMLRRKRWKGVKMEVVWWRWLPVPTLRNVWEWEYDDDEVERNIEDMKMAPEWLYPLVAQMVQGSQAFYHGQYPNMFKKAGGKDDDDKAPLIARTDTEMAVMKYQRFRSPEEVRRCKIPEAFSVMNSIAMEAEEREKMEREMKKR